MVCTAVQLNFQPLNKYINITTQYIKKIYKSWLDVPDGSLTSESSFPGLNIEKTHVWPRGNRSKEIRGKSKNVLGSNLKIEGNFYRSQITPFSFRPTVSTLNEGVHSNPTRFELF
jgi:hypothetical protein